MKFLAHIIGILNSALAAGMSCDRSQYLGLCQLVKTQIAGGKEQTAPYQFDMAGEGADATPNDQFQISTYHRALNMSTTRMPGGYGDGLGNLKLAIRMSLIVWANQLQVNLSHDEMALKLHRIIPERLQKAELPADITEVKFNITDVVLNSEQVFNEEFKNVDYFVRPEHIFLKVNYTIESTMSKICFNTLCGNPAA